MDLFSDENNSEDLPLDSSMGESERHKLFTIRYSEVIHRIDVELNPGFSMEDWETFMSFVRQKIGQDYLNWDLDLRRINTISSMLLGAMVTLNMVIRSQNGDLRLIVDKDSRVLQLFVLSKLNRIITVMAI